MKLILAVLAAAAALAVPASADAFCITCGWPYPAWVPTPAELQDDSCEGRGGVASMTEAGSFWRGGLLVIVYRVTCADGYSFEVEEETSGGISYEPPPDEPVYTTCPGSDSPDYDPNNPDCW
jgi:hypothetical protein